MRGIEAPTQLVSGPQQLVIGNVSIDLVVTDRAHTPTMYAVHLPHERVLYAPDTLSPDVFLMGWPPEA